MDAVPDAPPAPDAAADIAPDDLSKLSLEELQSKEQDLVAQFDAADEADDLDTMSTVADELDRVRAAIEEVGGDTEPDADADDKEMTMTASATTTETAPADTEAGAVDTADQPVVDSPASEEQAEVDTEAAPEPGDGEGDSTETSEPEGDQPEAEPEGGAEDGADETGDPTPEATTASGETTKEDTVGGDIPEKRQPVTVTASANEIIAGTDIRGFSAGMPFKDRMEVAVAMERKLEAVSRGRGPEENFMVASIVASASDDRTLKADDLAGNQLKIDEVTRPEVIVAAGGYCAPLETRYDIFGTGSTDRPVRDALAGFQAARGGIRYTAAPKITDFDAASGIWTAANDATPAEDVNGDVIPKNCLVVECQPEVTAVVDAVTLCLQFGNLMTRAYPELIDRNNQLALVAHARFAERALLNKLTALSISLTSGFKWGITRDFLLTVGKAATAYRARYRMDPTQPLRLLAPIWVRDAVREDLALQMPGDNMLSVADNVIDGFLRDRNVNVSWHLDAPGFSDEVAASTVDDFPATFDWYLYAEGAFIFLDGGTLDLGIVRDSQLVGTNDYKTFTESFEGVARIGAESLRVTTTTHVAGGSSGSVAVS